MWYWNIGLMCFYNAELIALDPIQYTNRINSRYKSWQLCAKYFPRLAKYLFCASVVLPPSFLFEWRSLLKLHSTLSTERVFKQELYVRINKLSSTRLLFRHLIRGVAVFKWLYSYRGRFVVVVKKQSSVHQWKNRQAFY